MRSVGQLHGGAGQVALVFFQFGLEAFEQGEGIRRAAGKSGNHLIVIQAAHLARIALHDGVAQRDLAVSADHHGIAAAHRDNGRAMILFQQ